jgi:hypothetical protein
MSGDFKALINISFPEMVGEWGGWFDGSTSKKISAHQTFYFLFG